MNIAICKNNINKISINSVVMLETKIAIIGRNLKKNFRCESGKFSATGLLFETVVDLVRLLYLR